MFVLLAAACCLISGIVHSPSGAPIPGAQIVLHGRTAQETHSDAKGAFTLQTDPGTYRIDALHRGYAPVSVSPVVVQTDTNVDILLEPADSPQLRTIGSVKVNGRLARVNGAIPKVTLTRADLARTGG